MAANQQALVVDNGSGWTKAGFAGDDTPRSIFPDVVGRPTHQGMDSTDAYVGDQAQVKRDLLSLAYPIQRGIVTNWDDMDKIYHHTFYNELRAAPEEHPVLMTEVPLNPKANREKMAQIVFETFNAPAFFLSVQAVLSLYTTGNTTGVVLDSGYGVTAAVSIHGGYILPRSVQKINYAGMDLTQDLQRSIIASGQSLGTDDAIAAACDIKERYCSVARTRAEVGTSSPAITYKLPDGNTIINLSSELMSVPEALFQPSSAGTSGSQHADFRNDLYGNIVLAGDTTMISNFNERLQNELSGLTPPSTPLKITASPDRKFSAWIGGSVMTSLSTFSSNWITKEEYDESGPRIVHRKCF
ncbi:actin family [Dissophora ornata]|nr:actin family [Dissophora ornata]